MMADLLVSAVIIAVIGAAIYTMIREKRKGRHCYGCNQCSCCKPQIVNIDDGSGNDKD